MKKTITILAALLMTGCTLTRPNALKVRMDGVTYITRYPNADRHKVGEVIMFPLDECGTHFAEQGVIIARLKLGPVVDDELTAEEVSAIPDSILN